MTHQASSLCLAAAIERIRNDIILQRQKRRPGAQLNRENELTSTADAASSRRYSSLGPTSRRSCRVSALAEDHQPGRGRRCTPTSDSG